MCQHKLDFSDGKVSPEEIVVRHVHTILMCSEAVEEDFPEELESIPGMKELHELCWSVRNAAASLSQGQLDFPIKGKGVLSGSFKALQSNLRHLTWQTQRIAEGDYSHRVSFLGDFSEAFNRMTEQLARQIEDLKTLSEQYRQLSHTDQLTGLYNRNAFIQYGGAIAAHMPKGAVRSSLIMIDLDHFKQKNDEYGHICGDTILSSFARTLSYAIRPRDLACRYGGEEFLVFLPDTPLDSAAEVAERLRRTVEEMRIHYEGKELRITASFGVSEISPKEGEYLPTDYLTAIQKADTNLYRAKALGRNRVVADEVDEA